jgi:hypothetical protein
VALSTGTNPAPIVAAFGSIWVASPRSKNLYRIDEQTNKVTAVIELLEPSCGPLVVAGGFVWVHACNTVGVVAVDPKTGENVGRLSALGVMGSGDATTWACAADGAHLSHIETPSMKELTQIAVPCGLQGFVDGNNLFVNDVDVDLAYSGTIRKVDVTTGAVVNTFQTKPSGNETFMTYAQGMIWSKARTDSTMTFLDTADGRTGQVDIPQFAELPSFGDNPPVAGLDSVWLRSGPRSVLRMDLRTGQVQNEYPTDPQAGGGHIAIGTDSLWVANFNSDTVWRFNAS